MTPRTRAVGHFFRSARRIGHDPRMQSERRALRSTDPAEAIRLFLACNATDVGMRAAVVSDDEGTLMGGVGDGDLAALAQAGSTAINVRDKLELKRSIGAPGLDPWDLHVVRLGVGARAFVITSLGAPLAAAGRLGAALGRILPR